MNWLHSRSIDQDSFDSGVKRMGRAEVASTHTTTTDNNGATMSGASSGVGGGTGKPATERNHHSRRRSSGGGGAKREHQLLPEQQHQQQQQQQQNLPEDEEGSPKMVITQLRDVESVVIRANGHAVAVGSNLDNGGLGAELISHIVVILVTLITLD